jgi:hypothetical protein
LNRKIGDFHAINPASRVGAATGRPYGWSSWFESGLKAPERDGSFQGLTTTEEPDPGFNPKPTREGKS